MYNLSNTSFKKTFNSKFKKIYQFYLSIYGVGHSHFKKLSFDQYIQPFFLLIIYLKQYKINKIRQSLVKNKIKYGEKLYTEIKNKINRLYQLNTYQGIRHSLKLPIKGQRTRSNASKRNKKLLTLKKKLALTIIEFNR
jgi:small subunit ribosomal protein S13